MNVPYPTISRVLAGLAVIALACGIAGESRADDQTEIAALYKKLESAMRAQSSEATLALLAPDFSYKARDGKILNGKQFADQLKVQKAGIKAVKEMKMKVTATHITGNTAKVTNEFSWAMQIEDARGQMGPKGMLHTMASTGSVENDLTKTPKGWRFVTLHTVNGNMTMDGKPIMRPGQAPPTPPHK